MSPGLSESESRSVEDEQILRAPLHQPCDEIAVCKKLEAAAVAASAVADGSGSDGGGTLPSITFSSGTGLVLEKVGSAGVNVGCTVPNGYEVKIETETGEQYYVNIFTGVAWYSAQDSTGRIYYYEENGNESCWELPNVSQTFQDHSVNASPVPDSDKQKSLLTTAPIKATISQPPLNNHPTAAAETIADSSKTENLRQKFYQPPVSSTAAPATTTTTIPAVTHRSPGPNGGPPHVQIGEISIVVLKQGSLLKTRLEERGKRYRKNWSLSNLVLTDMFLLFYKDAKAFASLQQQQQQSDGSDGGGSGIISTNNNCKPDQCVDLKGAAIEWCNSDKSKRLNVFEISTLLEQKLLLQDDDFTVANDWFSLIENVIVTLSQKELVSKSNSGAVGRCSLLSPTAAILGGSGSHTAAAAAGNSSTDSACSTLQSCSNKKSKIGRTKSLKLLTTTTGARESTAATTIGAAGGGGASTAGTTSVGGDPDSPKVVSIPLVKEKSRIREKLRKFFLRRPGVEDLMKRGIMKNEPVFGSTLVQLAKSEHSDVPLFVRKCIQVIESKTEYMSTDGVYRQSGNLSTVQRLRLQIDHGNATHVLDTVDDVHVLTGALKLFFRELKEPLIPWEAMERLTEVCSAVPSRKAKLRGLKEVVGRLPTAHQATLIALLRHLDKVTAYKEVNRMAVSNLAIVFGPTLMWPPAHLANTNMALNMMQQNMIVEALITNLAHIT